MSATDALLSHSSQTPPPQSLHESLPLTRAPSAPLRSRPQLPLSTESFLHELSDDDSLEIPQFNYNYDSDEPSPPTTVEPVTTHSHAKLVVPTTSAPSTGSASSSKSYSSLRGLPRKSAGFGIGNKEEDRRVSVEPLTSRLNTLSKSADEPQPLSRSWQPRPPSLESVGETSNRTSASHRASITGHGQQQERSRRSKSPEPSLPADAQRSSHETPAQRRSYLTSSNRSARPLRLLIGGAKRVRVDQLPPVEDDESPASRPSSPHVEALPDTPRCSPPSNLRSSPPASYPSRPPLHPRTNSRTMDRHVSEPNPSSYRPRPSDSPPQLAGRSPRSDSYDAESSASPEAIMAAAGRQATEGQWLSFRQSSESALRPRARSRASIQSGLPSPDLPPQDPRSHYTPSPETLAAAAPPLIARDYERRTAHMRQESEPYRQTAATDRSPVAHSSATEPSSTDKENPPPRKWKLGWSPPPKRESERDRDQLALKEINGPATTRETRTITKAPTRLSNTAPASTVTAYEYPVTATVRGGQAQKRDAHSPNGQGYAPTPSVPTTYRVQHEEMPAVPAKKASTFYVNKVPYTRLDVLGRGGSSKVYRVLSADNKIYALKKVTLDRADDETMNSYMNEIALLRRLDGNDRIIKLMASEASRKKGSLVMVLECGEVDMARLLEERRGQRLQFQWVETYWQQMLEAVQVIHEAAIVHSDLKPANFVLVRGSLKLIDFGIAKAIPNDTTNIQRDAQIGTANYMSPEAIEDTNQHNGEAGRCMKLGRPSDVWSLGCILYQMIYGAPPFYSLTTYQKMRAIPDPTYVIDFPESSIPSTRSDRGLIEVKTEDAVRIPTEVLDVLKSCLLRPPKSRRTIPEILASPWLTDWRGSSDGAARPPPIQRGIILKEDEFVLTVAHLDTILTVSSQYGAENGTCSEEMIRQWRTRILNQLAESKAA